MKTERFVYGMQTGTDGRGRGQVIIVAAFVIAVVFVGLALVLNSGIYAENLSSRETTDADGALSFSLATDEAVAGAYERTNAADESSADGAEDTFDGIVDDWAAAQQRRAASRGIGLEVDWTAHVGWRLEQDGDGTFEPQDGGEDWTLATDASEVAEFRLNVSRSGLYDSSTWNGVNSSFNVSVSDGSDVWQMYVFQNSSHVIVHDGVPGEYPGVSSLPDDETCASETDRATIDFRAETLDGSDCEPLNFSDDVDGAIDVSFENGTQVTGTYDLVVNGSSAADTSNFNDPTGDDPTATAVIYSASYASHYGKSDLTHGRNGTYPVRDETHAS